MRIQTICLALCIVLLSPYVSAQGWSHFGPDSSNWQDVREINLRWFGSDSLYLAASVGGGIALKLADRDWNYSLAMIGDGTHIPYTFYQSLQFSPWEPDSAFLAYEIMVPDPVPQVLKIAVPCSYPPFWAGDLGGPCFQLSSGTFFPVERDSFMYALMCGLYRSLKPWRTWVQILDSRYEIPRFLAIDRVNPSVLWTSVSQGDQPLILHSANGGTTWDTVTSFPFLPYGAAIVASGDTILLAQWSPGDSAAFKGIVQSSDAGKSWNPRYTQSGVSVLRWGTGNTVFAGGPSGIMVSEDAGSTWQIFNNGLPGTLITDIAVNPYSDTLFVSILNYGVLKVWNSLAGVGSGSPLPAHFALNQNYPNPFNPSTTIKYELPTTLHVSLMVYDILGRVVSVLVNETKPAGVFTVAFDASGFASGVYFYGLVAGSFAKTKRLVLIR